MTFGVRRIYSFIIVFVFCGAMFSMQLKANEPIGSPILKNYQPHQYRANSQNWSATEDSRGVLYFANIDGVLEYDGVNWNLIELPDNKPATSIASAKNGTIYVGSHSEFGYLTPDDNGKLVYESMLHLFPDDEQEFSFIWKIVVTSHGVFFNNYDKFYHLHDDKLKIWKPDRFSHFFGVNNRIYLFDVNPDEGLKYFDGADLVSFDEKNSLSDFHIVFMHPFSEEKILIYCAINGVYLVNNILDNPEMDLFEPEPLKNQEVYNSLKDNDITHSIKLRNGNYAFATILDGVYIMERDGSLNRVINKSTGLQNQTVNYLYESCCEILWMALDNGISSVNINYPMTYWDDAAGFEGSILDIIRFKGDIYISTWQGVYRLSGDDLYEESQKAINQFQKVEDISARAWSFLVVGDAKYNDEKLLVATSRGIYEINGNRSNLLVDGSFISTAKSSQNNNILLFGTGRGLFLLYYNDEMEVFETLKLIDDLAEYEIYNITEDKPGMFWLTHRSEGITAIKFDNLEKIQNASDEVFYKIYHFGNDHGIPDKLSLYAFKTKRGIVFSATSSFYFFEYNEENRDIELGEFVAFSEFLNDYLKRKYAFTKIKIDQSDNCWVQFFSRISRERVFFLIKGFDSDNLKNAQYKLLPIRQTQINRILFENDKQVAWFGGDDALFRFDSTVPIQVLDQNIGPLIRNIRVNNRTIFSGTAIEDNFVYDEEFVKVDDLVHKEFSYSENSFSFDFAYPVFFDPEYNLYNTYLKNYDEHWSGWSYETHKTYNNLPPGEYVFKVKSKDPFGNESEENGFAFRITEPWYKTQTAFVIYLLVVIVVIYIIIKIANRQLVKAKTNLEQVVRERTSEIANQRKKLEIEKEKSDKLLRNILPFKIAQELKTYGNVRAQYYEKVTVMFMDFKDFSKTSQFINPLHLLGELDRSFGYFDEVCARHNLEKIKTMGDAYMCAGGIPQPNKTNPFDAILAAFEILEFVKKAEKNQWLCELRIGIHTGEIIAGIIGKNKFAYDIWGETVNTASRLESTGEINKINISGETYNIVKDYFVCTYRGRLPAKHSDEYQMYFVNRIKKEYSADSSGKKPNKEFIDIILNMK